MLDQNAVLSDEQAITATAPSTKTLNMVDFPFFGMEGLAVNIQVVEDFATLTSLTADLQFSADGNSGWTTVETSGPVLLADLKAGKLFPVRFSPEPPKGKEYMRVNYTVTGSNASAGKVTTYIGSARPEGYRDGLYFDWDNTDGTL